jgi:hypothetical protein
MSRLYFHSEHGDAELSGAEFYHLQQLCKRLAFGLLDLRGLQIADRVRSMLVPGCHARAEPPAREFQYWCGTVETSMAIASDETKLLEWNGQHVGVLSLILNTALTVGSGPVQLAARIAGQGEIHGYVEGRPYRSAFADLIDEGLESGVYRRLLRGERYPGIPGDPSPLGWEDVTRLLRSRDDGPVVMSYSAEDSFPNRKAAGWKPPQGTDLRPEWARAAPAEWDALADAERSEYEDETASELWGNLPHGEQWRLGMEGMRAAPGNLEINPLRLAGDRFGHGLSVLDLTAEDWRERLDAAFADEPALS